MNKRLISYIEEYYENCVETVNNNLMMDVKEKQSKLDYIFNDKTIIIEMITDWIKTINADNPGNKSVVIHNRSENKSFSCPKTVSDFIATRLEEDKWIINH